MPQFHYWRAPFGPPQPIGRVNIVDLHFWSFHLTDITDTNSTTPEPTVYAEIIFMFADPILTLPYHPPPSNLSLSIANLVGITAGTGPSVDGVTDIYPNDFTGAELDLGDSTASVAVHDGIATLNSLNLDISDVAFLSGSSGPNNGRFSVGTTGSSGGEPQGLAEFYFQGTWLPKSSWSTLSALGLGRPPLPTAANPPLPQPTSGEFSK